MQIVEDNNAMPDTVTLTLETYTDMIRQVEWLSYLEEAGVDNWEGIDYAAELAQRAGYFDEEDNV